MNGFKVPAVITRCSSMVDGGLSIGIHTNELKPEEKVEIMNFHNKSGWMLFSSNPIEDSDIPKQRAEIGDKTPSQRLRAVLFILWDLSDKSQDFDSFYKDKMEMFIEKVKSRLSENLTE